MMKILRKEIVRESTFLNLCATVYRDQKGKTRVWTWVERPNERKAVLIVAQVGSRLAVIREYRVPIGGYEWGFPAGLLDGDEPIETTARRELKEETGLEISKIHKVSPFVYNSAGITNESIAMVYASAKGEVSKKNLESSEDIETFLMDQAEVKKMLKDTDKMFGAKAWIILDYFATTGQLPV